MTTKPIQVLIIEDDQEWQEILCEPILELTSAIQSASNRQEAEEWLKGTAFELIVLDLNLWDIEGRSSEAVAATIELLKEIRQSGVNGLAAIVIVTAFPEADDFFGEVLQTRLANNFIKKKNFSKTKFLEALRQAILDAQTERMAATRSRRILLTLRSGDREWLGWDLSGARSLAISLDHPTAFSAARFAEMGERIGELFVAERKSSSPLGSLWRPMAKDAGRALFDELQRQPKFAELLRSATVQVQTDSGFLLQLLSPAAGLQLPFELLHDGEDFLCLKHSILRRVGGLGADFRRPNQELAKLIQALKKAGSTFRILIVAAQSQHSPLPSIDAEITIVSELAQQGLQKLLGVRVETRILAGPAASIQGVREAIQDGFHFLHYAGHGTFNEKLPERSGIVLHQGGQPKVLTAAQLKDLVVASSLRFCFFNCCLSAKSGASADRGDFVGLSQALLTGGVPTILGHRWAVLDGSAVSFAQAFYEDLWRSFRFEDAVLAGRLAVAQGDSGRDDPGWASPVLIDQST